MPRSESEPALPRSSDGAAPDPKTACSDPSSAPKCANKSTLKTGHSPPKQGVTCGRVTIIRQVCSEMGVTIINGALSHDHVHMFVEIPPHVSVSDFVRRAKGRSSRSIQQALEHIRKGYWGQRFWGRGYFSTTAGNISEDIIMGYLDRHIRKDDFSPAA
ncbi:IS200/IS605 family transposase [Novosphingobium aquae]|uniref:IS200/IS605 family transposase n=1 Tax=Novosphingobium aquae TaxID=3133435 RepID=A0ABU8SE40_9SPHN